jgi:hypothetical protein
MKNLDNKENWQRTAKIAEVELVRENGFHIFTLAYFFAGWQDSRLLAFLSS